MSRNRIYYCCLILLLCVASLFAQSGEQAKLLEQHVEVGAAAATIAAAPWGFGAKLLFGLSIFAAIASATIVIAKRVMGALFVLGG